MPSIDVAAFLGITPMVGKEELPNEAATLAENCRLEGGDLESWNDVSTIKVLSSLTPILSIYRYGVALGVDTDFWFQFTTDVDVVKGPIAGDIEERTYWTGDGSYPKKTKADIATVAPPYPSNSFAIGIPAPVDPPTVTITGVATDPVNDPAETAVWGYTYVSSWGEEGPMSPLSTTQTWRPGQTPVISLMSGNPPGPYTIATKRIYRSASGTSATALQFSGEVPVGTPGYTDNVLTVNLGKLAETRLWTPPPDDIKGLCLMANEIMAAFTGATVRLSVPGVPYAWPERNSYTFPAPVVGIKPFGQSLLVCTTRSVHILTGVDPSAMSEELVSGAGVCVSKRGMVDMLDGVIYPTKRGLQYVGPSGPTLLTAVQFDEVKWAAYKPTSFTAAQVNSRYVASYDTGSVQGGLVFSFVTPQAVVTSTVYGTAMWQEKGTDSLYLVQSNTVKKWDGGSPLLAKWKSKSFRFSSPVSMAAARVEADAYPFTFKVFANDALIHTESVLDRYGFTLPAEDEYSEYAFQYEGTTRVTRVNIATSMEELKQNGR